jgi:predicted N-acetyltransferase YhbS
MPSTPAIRLMTPEDLPAVDHVQRDAYVEQFQEQVAVFADKLQRFPAGCWVCVSDGQIVGYMFSHPARLAAPPGLNVALREQQEPYDCYFIHDIAVLTSHRSLGVAQKLLKEALGIAKRQGYDVVALISVQGSRGYWERFGFRELSEPQEAVDYVRRSYGESAYYMARCETNALG